MRKITNLTEAFDNLKNIDKPKKLRENLNPDTIYDYIDEYVSMERLGSIALTWLSADELVDMLEANGYEDEDEFEESLKDNSKNKSLSEDFIISPEKEYTSKSGHKILIKDVIPYVSEYDGTAYLEIKYDYKLNGSDEWKSSKCNQHDLFKMLTESPKNESLKEDFDKNLPDYDDSLGFKLTLPKSIVISAEWTNKKFSDGIPVLKAFNGKDSKFLDDIKIKKGTPFYINPYYERVYFPYRNGWATITSEELYYCGIDDEWTEDKLINHPSGKYDFVVDESLKDNKQ